MRQAEGADIFQIVSDPAHTCHCGVKKEGAAGCFAAPSM
jgi:hypothetical protein